MVLSVLLCKNPVHAQWNLSWDHQYVGGDVWNVKYYPSLKLGSHNNVLSYHVAPAWYWSLGQDYQMRIGMHSVLSGNITHLGIAGASLLWRNRVQVALSSGPVASAFQGHFFYDKLRKNNIGYYYQHYASTDLTHQFSAGVNYTLAQGNMLVCMGVENDALAFLGLDEYRTAAFVADVKWIRYKYLWGVGLELLLWTGSTKGLDRLDYGQEYNMEGQHGSQYSHGILSLRLHFRQFTVKVGYDADGIRKAVQNTSHWLINDGIIPRGSESRDRLYVQLAINTEGWLY